MSRRSGQNGSIQKDGKWYVVRYWKDVPGQEKRVRVRAKICPISGPGKLSVSERERKAKEIIAASGVDTKEYFDRVVTQSKATVVTFRQQVETWLAGMRNRRSKPVAPSTLSGWESGLKNWLNPNLGDLPLEAVDNLALKKLVNKMVEGGLSASTICNYADVVKMVVASVINEKGDEVYPRKWNDAFINMPVINPRKQRTPSFTGDVVSGIVAAREYTYRDTKRNVDVKCELRDEHRMLFILSAASGLRFGEALGIEIPHVSADGSCIHICQKAWRGQMHDTKTRNGEREIDLHPSVANLLQEFIGERKSGLLFCTRTGRQLHQSNILRRSCVPAFSQHVLAQLHFYPARSLSVLDGAREWEAGAYGRDDVRPLRQGRTRTGVAQGMGRKSGLGLQASARVQASPEPKVGSTSATKLSFWTEWTENRNFGTARNGCKPMIGWRLLDYSPVPKRQKSVG